MSDKGVTGQGPSGLHLFFYKTKKSLKTPMPYLAFVGIGMWLLSYFLLIVWIFLFGLLLAT